MPDRHPMKCALPNPEPKTDWKAGDRCCYFDITTCQLVHSKVKKVRTGLVDMENGDTRLYELLFQHGEKAAQAFLNDNAEFIREKAKSVKTLAQLHKYPVVHNVCRDDPNCDWMAYFIYLRAVEDLMGSPTSFDPATWQGDGK